MFCRARVERVTAAAKHLHLWSRTFSSGYRERYVSDCTNTDLLPFLCFEKRYDRYGVDDEEGVAAGSWVYPIHTEAAALTASSNSFHLFTILSLVYLKGK